MRVRVTRRAAAAQPLHRGLNGFCPGVLAGNTTVLSGLVLVACWVMMPVAVAAMCGLCVFGAVSAGWRWSVVTVLCACELAAVAVAASIAGSHIPF